jgi:hypothetical protein
VPPVNVQTRNGLKERVSPEKSRPNAKEAALFFLLMCSVNTDMNAAKCIDTPSPIRIPGYRPFVTDEQRFCAKESDYSSYWLKNDELCRAVLETGTDPKKFELIRAFFPVVRTAVSFEFPLSESGLPHWWAFCFYAGWQFGKSRPAPARGILATLNTTDLEDLLTAIDQLHGKKSPDPNTLSQSFEFIWKQRPPSLGIVGIQSLILSALINAFAAGIASVLWIDQRSECRFIRSIQIDYTDPALPLHVRVIQSSAAADHARPISERLEHPLLKAAAAQYPVTPIERAAIMPFFHRELWKNSRNAAGCPCSALDLVNWVAGGLRYGRELRRRNPHLPEALRSELGEKTYSVALETCASIRKSAPSNAPLAITHAALAWHERVYGWKETSYVGAAIDRVVRFSDLAIWTGMVQDLKDK